MLRGELESLSFLFFSFSFSFCVILNVISFLKVSLNIRGLLLNITYSYLTLYACVAL
jgi:hypothetical protein